MILHIPLFSLFMLNPCSSSSVPQVDGEPSRQEPAVQDLIAQLESESNWASSGEFVSRKAITALLVRDRAAVEELVRAMEPSRSWNLRLSAAYVLSQMGSIEAIERQLVETNDLTWKTACYLLLQSGPISSYQASQWMEEFEEVSKQVGEREFLEGIASTDIRMGDRDFQARLSNMRRAFKEGDTSRVAAVVSSMGISASSEVSQWYYASDDQAERYALAVALCGMLQRHRSTELLDTGSRSMRKGVRDLYHKLAMTLISQDDRGQRKQGINIIGHLARDNPDEYVPILDRLKREDLDSGIRERARDVLIDIETMIQNAKEPGTPPEEAQQAKPIREMSTTAVNAQSGEVSTETLSPEKGGRPELQSSLYEEQREKLGQEVPPDRKQERLAVFIGVLAISILIVIMSMRVFRRS